MTALCNVYCIVYRERADDRILYSDDEVIMMS